MFIAKNNWSHVIQSSQVNLLAKSEIFDGIAIVCDVAGVTRLGGSGDMLPYEILENEGSEEVFSFILSENVML